MLKRTIIGALAPMFLVALPAWADWRTPIHGAEPTLPSAFTPLTVHRAPPRALAIRGATPILPPRFTPASVADPSSPQSAPFPRPPSGMSEPAPAEPNGQSEGASIDTDTQAPVFVPAPATWSLPLVDRRLSAADRSADLASELNDAIARIEPMYDPTRLDGPDAEVSMVVSPGTAAMDNVFADHWRLASPDANVNTRVASIAMAWQRVAPLPCEAFAKTRPHQVGEVALTALSGEDCRVLMRDETLRYDEARPIAIVTAPVSVPVFAAPLPGSRMSSAAFWAARKARIEAIHAHLRDKWLAGHERVSDAGLRP